VWKALRAATASDVSNDLGDTARLVPSEWQPRFRWARDVESVTVIVEFLCETDEVPPGRIFKPTSVGEYTGSKLGAFNVRGAHLVRDDFIERDIEGERVGRGNSDFGAELGFSTPTGS